MALNGVRRLAANKQKVPKIPKKVPVGYGKKNYRKKK